MVSRKVPHDHETRNDQLLIAGARVFGVELSPSQVRSFEQYVDLLAFWNRRLNLTAIRDPDLVVRRHFVDSFSVVPFLSVDGGVLDVGSGAGFPGIPIKLALPGKPVHLVEPRRKRANFLRQVARELRLADVHVIEKRVEDLSAEPLPPIEETVTRGFSDIPGFLKASADLLGPGGLAVLMQGPKGMALLEELRACISGYGLTEGENSHFKLPFGGEQRTVLTFRKT